MDLGFSKRGPNYGSLWGKVFIPFEILSMICSFAAARSPVFELGNSSRNLSTLHDYHHGTRAVKSMRLVCRAFNNAALHLLITEVSLASDPASIKRLTSIMDHPQLSQNVQVLHLYCHQYDDHLIRNPAAYNTALRDRGMISKHSDKKLVEGYCHLNTMISRQKECRAQLSDVQCFAEALGKFPRLSSITFETKDEAEPYRCRFDCAIRSKLAHILYPGTDEQETFHVAALYLDTLCQPNVISNLKTIRLPRLGSEVLLALQKHAFGSAQNAELRLSGLFKGVERIFLDFGSRFEVPRRSTSFQELESYERLLLGCVKQESLEALAVNIPNAGPELSASYTKLIISQTFPRLALLKLSAYDMWEPDLIDFLARHQRTLRHVEFDHCSISQGSWYNVVACMKDFDSLKLCYFSVKFCFDSEHRQGRLFPNFGNDLTIASEVLIKYLYKGGFMPICTTDAASMQKSAPWRQIRTSAELERRLTEAASTFVIEEHSRPSTAS